MSSFPRSRQSDLVIQELEKELLIYDLKTDKTFCFNESSAFVWNLCDGNRPIEEIRRLLNKQLKSDVSEDYVWLALDQFKENNLLENNEHFAIDFGGLNRRQIIKKVGLASMAMLPVITALAAPKAVMAASPQPFRSACTSNAGCQSGNCANNVCCNPGATGNAPVNQLINCSNTANGCSGFAASCCSNSIRGDVSSGAGNPCVTNGFAYSCFCN